MEFKKGVFNLRNQQGEKSYIETSNSDGMSNAFST